MLVKLLLVIFTFCMRLEKTSFNVKTIVIKKHFDIKKTFYNSRLFLLFKIVNICNVSKVKSSCHVKTCYLDSLSSHDHRTRGAGVSQYEDHRYVLPSKEKHGRQRVILPDLQTQTIRLVATTVKFQASRRCTIWGPTSNPTGSPEWPEALKNL